MNLKLKLTLKISLIAVLAGTVIALCGLFAGAKSTVIISAEGIRAVDTTYHEVPVEDFNLGTFTNIDIDTYNCDIQFEFADKAGIQGVTYENSMYKKQLHYGVENDTLRIRHSTYGGEWHATLLNLPHSGISSGGRSSITVYLPYDTVFEQVTIDNSYGNLTLNGLTANNVFLSDSYGKQDISDCSFETFSASLYQSDLSLAGLQFADAAFDSSYGSIHLSDWNFKHDGNVAFSGHYTDIDLERMNMNTLKIESYQSNIKASDIKSDRSQFDLSYGNVSAKNFDAGSTTFHSSYGDFSASGWKSKEFICSEAYQCTLTLDGSLLGTNEFNSTYGSVSLIADKPITDYQINISGNYSDIRVTDGDNASSSFSEHYSFQTGEAKHAIVADAYQTTIDLQFK